MRSATQRPVSQHVRVEKSLTSPSPDSSVYAKLMTFTCSPGSQIRWPWVMQNSQCTPLNPVPFFPTQEGDVNSSDWNWSYYRNRLESVLIDENSTSLMSFRLVMSDSLLPAMLLIPNWHIPVSHSTLSFHSGETEAQRGTRTRVKWVWREVGMKPPVALSVTQNCL